MRVNILISTLLLLALTCSANGLNILAILPYDGKSHFIIFKVLLYQLAHKGHNLTVISHFPDNNPPPNYRDINLHIPPKQFTPEDSLKLQRSYWNILEVGVFLATNGRKNCKIMLANKEVQDLVNKKAKFDVIVTEEFNSDCSLGLAYKLGAPVVRLTSHVLMPWHYGRLGIPYNPSYVPMHFLEGGNNPTLLQRVERVIFDAYFKFLFYAISQRSDQNTLAEYYDDIPPLEDLARNIKFLLVNHHFTLTGSRLFPANVIEVGGYHVTQNPLTGVSNYLYSFFVGKLKILRARIWILTRLEEPHSLSVNVFMVQGGGQCILINQSTSEIADRYTFNTKDNVPVYLQCDISKI